MADIDLGIEGLSGAEPIGSGGNAVVYRALDVDHDRWVAVKVLRGLGDEDELRRFDRERRTMGRLSEHEGIVTIHSSGITTRGEPYLVMSLLEDGSLEDQLQQGPIGWRDACKLMLIVAETVDAAHQQSVIHRDLKPANIMLSGTGRPLVADFGIARAIDSSTSLQSTAITMTPAYSPPEVIEGADPTVAADVYALGATLFALIDGKPPFVASKNESIFALLSRVASDPVRDLRPTGVPDPVCVVIEKAMSKAPAERHSTAGEFAVALSHAADTPPASEERQPPDISDRSSETVVAGRPLSRESIEENVASPLTTKSAPADGEVKRIRLRLVGALALVGVIVGGILVLSSRGDEAGDVATTASSSAPESTIASAEPSSSTTQAPLPASSAPTSIDTSFDSGASVERPVGAKGAVLVSVGASVQLVDVDGSGVTVDLTAMLDELGAGGDNWITSSRNGEWLAMDTERFGCQDWSCLVTARSDMTQVAVVRAAGEQVHPQDWGAVSGDGSMVIFTTDLGPHILDLAVVRRSGDEWAAPVILTEDSEHDFNERGRLTRDEAALLFDCGPTQYGQAGTGVCRVALDGSGLEQLVGPSDGPGGTELDSARSADEKPDGSIVFEADWGGAERLWSQSSGEFELVSGLANDNSPCVLLDGSILSLWYGRPNNGQGFAELKVHGADSTDYEMILVGLELNDVGMHCVDS